MKKKKKIIKILSALLVLSLVVLIALVIIANKKNINIFEDEEAERDITYTLVEQSNYYSQLVNVYIESNDSKFLVLLPGAYLQNEDLFRNAIDEKIEWTCEISLEQTLDSYFDSLDNYVNKTEHLNASEVVYGGQFRYRILTYEDGGIECHYCLDNGKDLCMTFVFGFNTDNLEDKDKETLNQLKEVYSIELLEVPEIESYNPDHEVTLEELDALYGTEVSDDQ